MKISVTSTLSSLCLLVPVLGLSSCIEVPLFGTEHPDYGVITTLTTDWSNRTDGVAVPKEYRVWIGEEYDEILQGATNVIDLSFSPDMYRIRAYNPADRIVVKDTEASVAATDTDGFVEAQPDWFFTASEEESIDGDKDESITLVMQQQVRQLSFVFTVISNRTSRLMAIDAVLEGVAGSLDIDKGEVTGTPVNVIPLFKEQSEDVYQATVRLLGVVGNTQTLRLNMFFRGGLEITRSMDVSYLLADFNSDKKTPLLLSTQIVENQSEELGFTVSFGEWDTKHDIMVIIYGD